MTAVKWGFALDAAGRETVLGHQGILGHQAYEWLNAFYSVVHSRIIT